MIDDLLSLDAVAFAPPFPNPAPTDEKGSLEWIDLRDLRIDPKYQRPIGGRGEKNIKQVIENFSWSLFSPLVVCERPNGLYAVIDGQHRAIAARTHGGIDKVPCLVIKGDPSDEAKAFSVINGAVTAISEQQIWHARLVAGDNTAVRLQRVLEKTGVSIPRSQKPSTSMIAGETMAIGALEKAFKTYGTEVLELAIRTIVETGKGNPGLLRAPLITATTAVLSAHPKWLADDQGVVRAIKTVGIKYLYEVAERFKLEADMTMIAAYAAGLIALFNKNLGDGK